MDSIPNPSLKYVFIMRQKKNKSVFVIKSHLNAFKIKIHETQK